MECAYLCLNYLIHQTACATQSLDNIDTPQVISPKTNGMHQRYQIKWQVHVHPLTIASHNDLFRTKIKNEASPILLIHSLYSYYNYSDDHTYMAFPLLTPNNEFFIAVIKGERIGNIFILKICPESVQTNVLCGAGSPTCLAYIQIWGLRG